MPQALEIIVSGKAYLARQALHAGMVDELVPREYLLAAARQWLARGKRPREFAHSAAVNAVVDAVIAPAQRHAVEAKTHGNLPAVEKALDVVLKGSASRDEAKALEREREAVAQLLTDEATKQLLHLYFQQESAKKFSVPNAPDVPHGITRTAVIGAGVMVSGIAQWLSARGLRVILRDVNAAALAEGMGNIAGLYASAVRKRLFTEREARVASDRVSPAPAEVPLKHVDLVIEAAVEKMDVKKEIFRRLDELTREDAILATNTSALPISELAAATRHPRRVIGLHFFNPVHKLQLVEVIAGRDTAPEVAQRAVRFAQRIGKLPVLVKDSPGFLVNRILVPYLIEAGVMFWNGAEVKDIDAAMLHFGLPMGPLRLIDEIGADIALDVAATLAAAFPGRINVPEVLPALVGTFAVGRKVGKGFYKYKNGAQASPNKEVLTLRPRSPAAEPSRDEIEQRLILLMINEGARCLEEGIVGSAGDVDLAMVMGTGFAPFRGGPLRYADSIAVIKVVEDLSRYAQSAGAHYEPCALLREMAKSGKRFYED